jgi:hypothetical protein
MLVIPAEPEAEMLVTPLDEVRRKMKGKREHGG